MSLNASSGSPKEASEIDCLVEASSPLTATRCEWVDSTLYWAAFVLGLSASTAVTAAVYVCLGEHLAVTAGAVCLSLTTCFCALVHLGAHVFSTRPREPGVIPILLLCPVFSLGAAVHLVAARTDVGIDLIQLTLEGYAMLALLDTLTAELGGTDAVCALYAERRPFMSLPLRCLPKIRLDGAKIVDWRRLVWQYIMLSPLFAIVELVLFWWQHESNRVISADNPAFWVQMARVVSLVIAMRGVTLFCVSVSPFFDSSAVRPLVRFGAIKIVIFLSVGQPQLVAFFDRSAELINTLIIAQLVLVTPLHRYCFPSPRVIAERRRCWLLEQAEAAANRSESIP